MFSILARLTAGALGAAALAAPGYGCALSMPLHDGMFAALEAPVDALTALPGDAGAFVYLDETRLDTLRVGHKGGVSAWTAADAQATCAQPEARRSCSVMVDAPHRFARITMTKERRRGMTVFRYRALMVEGRRHVRLFPRAAASRSAAACNLMKSVDSFRRTYMR